MSKRQRDWFELALDAAKRMDDTPLCEWEIGWGPPWAEGDYDRIGNMVDSLRGWCRQYRDYTVRCLSDKHRRKGLESRRRFEDKTP